MEAGRTKTAREHGLFQKYISWSGVSCAGLRPCENWKVKSPPVRPEGDGWWWLPHGAIPRRG